MAQRDEKSTQRQPKGVRFTDDERLAMKERAKVLKNEVDQISNATEAEGEVLRRSLKCLTLTGSGVGAIRGWHAMRWIRGEKIVVPWILTFPSAALIGAAG